MRAIGRVGLKVEPVLGPKQNRHVFAPHQNHNGQAPYKKTGSLIVRILVQDFPHLYRKEKVMN